VKCRDGCGRAVTRYRALVLANACYERWRRAGFPQDIPRPEHAGNDRCRPDRLEDFRELRQLGETREMAATRLGVSVRTVERYEAALRAGAA
jgi:hypothetical protein